MSLRHFTFAALAVPFALLVPRAAHAGIEACNNIDVRAEASCTVVAQGGCDVQCEPTKFTLACAGKLTTQCDGECRASADVSCTGSCTADCKGTCEASPGSFDCRGSCEGSCDADCDAQCAGSASGNTATGSCKAACSANCSAKCDARCEGTPPTATCEGKCEASCSGSCEAKASAKCQIDCQAKLEGSCKADLQGGCKAQCQKPEGALFCDGQYVDAGNNLRSCIDALNAYLNVKVSGSASAECQGNACTAEAEDSATCSASRERLPSPSSPLVPTIVVLAAIGATVARMNRRGGPR
jgi:hypothetical protein